LKFINHVKFHTPLYYLYNKKPDRTVFANSSSWIYFND